MHWLNYNYKLHDSFECDMSNECSVSAIFHTNCFLLHSLGSFTSLKFGMWIDANWSNFMIHNLSVIFYRKAFIFVVAWMCT